MWKKIWFLMGALSLAVVVPVSEASAQGTPPSAQLTVPRPDPDQGTELDNVWLKLENMAWRGAMIAIAIGAASAVIAAAIGHFGTHGSAAMAARKYFMGVAAAAFLAGGIFPFVDFVIATASEIF